MRTLLEHVAKQLVEDPNAVVVTEELDGDFIKLHLQVGEADVGKVIGRQGRTATALRTVMAALAGREKCRLRWPTRRAHDLGQRRTRRSA
jgi:predicted RNA-binding protein YlqC (UPF0109 family)